MTIDDSNLKRINLDLLEILPIFSSYHIYENISHFVKSIQHLLETVLFKENHLHYNQISDPIFFEKLENFLPIISHSEIQPPPSYFSISCLSLKDFTDGIERFIPDMISRWLIPGKQITINGNQSLGFRFKNFSNKTYYLSESFIAIENEIDYKFISKNIDSFINELRINILSVYHARRISSGTNLSPEEKNTIIKKISLN